LFGLCTHSFFSSILLDTWTWTNMAFVWVQQWVALPVVYEGQGPMGDLPPGTRAQALDSAATGFARDGNQGLSTPSSKPQDNTTPFHSQLSAIPQNQLRPDFRPSAHSTTQYLSQEHGASPLNMSSMAGALPEYGSVDDASVNPQGSQSIPRSLSGASTSAVVYQLGQNLQLPAHAPGGMPNHPPYGNAYVANPYQQQAFSQSSQHNAYPQFGANQSRMPTASMQAAYQNYPGPSQYMYYPAPYGHQGQYNPGYPAQGLQSQALYGRRGSTTDVTAGLTSPHNMNYQHLDGGFQGPRVGTGGLQGDQAVMGLPFTRTQGKPDLSDYGNVQRGFAGMMANSMLIGMTQSGLVSSIPRGPPRKPKQSGHALWVGNLPPGTTVMALKDHFSREATKDIESLFLISKSNCAFVNYRSEASCTAAMHRFHDSRFNGVRLVCRLRRSSAPASGVPTGPSAMVGSQQASASPPRTPKVDIEATENHQESVTEQSPHKDSEIAPATSTSPNKYFIVKSLTLQDLELSVRNGIWATQSHNEDVLNKAFRVSMHGYFQV
jgi:hypothetical protein